MWYKNWKIVASIVGITSFSLLAIGSGSYYGVQTIRTQVVSIGSIPQKLRKVVEIKKLPQPELNPLKIFIIIHLCFREKSCLK